MGTLKRRNLAPPLGPDLCTAPECKALAQTSLSLSRATALQLGFLPGEDELFSARVCVACYLKGMAEAHARARTKRFTKPAAPGINPPVQGGTKG